MPFWSRILGRWAAAWPRRVCWILVSLIICRRCQSSFFCWWLLALEVRWRASFWHGRWAGPRWTSKRHQERRNLFLLWSCQTFCHSTWICCGLWTLEIPLEVQWLASESFAPTRTHGRVISGHLRKGTRSMLADWSFAARWCHWWRPDCLQNHRLSSVMPLQDEQHDFEYYRYPIFWWKYLSLMPHGCDIRPIPNYSWSAVLLALIRPAGCHVFWRNLQCFRRLFEGAHALGFWLPTRTPVAARDPVSLVRPFAYQDCHQLSPEPYYWSFWTSLSAKHESSLPLATPYQPHHQASDPASAKQPLGQSRQWSWQLSSTDQLSFLFPIKRNRNVWYF